jgi:uncharacterized membrane protein YheB (UPF0754 family)
VEILNFILPPLLGGIIAFSTNWLALIMLFRPHKEKRVFGIKLPFTPGLIPKEQARLAKKLAEVISAKILSPEVLAEEFSDLSVWPLPDITVGEALRGVGIIDDDGLSEPFAEKFRDLIDEHLPKSMTALSAFPEKYPQIDARLQEWTYKIIDENVSTLAGFFISKEKIYNRLKENAKIYLVENHDEVKEQIYDAMKKFFAEENIIMTEKIYNLQIKDWLGEVLEKRAIKRVFEIFAKYLAEHIPLATIIENRIAAIDVAEAEKIILTVVKRELRLIVLLGGVLGFIIGLLAVFI